jgi:acetoin utilization deacetylase AcuC-like enzyme
MKRSNMQSSIYWNPDYVASDYAFDTTRKSGEIAAIIEAGDKTGSLVDPAEFTLQTREVINRIHAAEYVDAVTSGMPLGLAESQGFRWDPKISTMAIAHSSGLVAGVNEVLSGRRQVAGSLSSGLHHARSNRGAGFCTFNGLAVAARAALDLGAERILVLDLDAHCGGGTRSMTDPDSVVQIDVSTVGFDRWTASGNDALLMAHVGDYVPRVTEALRLADAVGPFDLVLYNAGMDPANSGVSASDLRQRERMVAEWTDRHGFPWFTPWRVATPTASPWRSSSSCTCSPLPRFMGESDADSLGSGQTYVESGIRTLSSPQAPE